MRVRVTFNANSLDDVLPRLEQVEKRSDGSYMACCPAHADSNPSLHVTPSGRRLLFSCFAGCSYDEIVAALEGRENGWREPTQPDAAGIEAVHDYQAADRTLLFQVVRKAGKRFVQRRKVGTRWVNNLNGVERIPYRLPELVEAVARGETVYVVEGEKDADAIIAAGGAATCNPGGAGKWRDEYAQYLRGARVVIVADRDESGARHARQEKRSLVGVASSVRVVEALTGKDAADHLAAGHGLDEFVAADRFARFDLGPMLAEGVEPPPFLVEGVLYEGRSHAVMGEPGDGKTLVVLGLAVALIKSGRRVAWFDEENGAAVIAARLLALEATPDEVANFFYYPFTEPTLDDADELADEMAAIGPALVVFDSGADLYAASGLDENSNMDMTAWARAYSQHLSRALGIASVVLEHVAKTGDGSYQRGAGAKKAKVDASWRLEVVSPFDHETVGEVELVRKKDRLAHLAKTVRYRIGGDGSGCTVFERVPIEDEQASVADDARRKREHFRSEAIRVLRDNGATTKDAGLTQRTLTGLLSPATQAFKNEVVQHLASDPTTPVKNGRGPRHNSIVYWLEERENDE